MVVVTVGYDCIAYHSILRLITIILMLLSFDNPMIWFDEWCVGLDTTSTHLKIGVAGFGLGASRLTARRPFTFNLCVANVRVVKVPRCQFVTAAVRGGDALATFLEFDRATH